MKFSQIARFLFIVVTAQISLCNQTRAADDGEMKCFDEKGWHEINSLKAFTTGVGHLFTHLHAETNPAEILEAHLGGLLKNPPDFINAQLLRSFQNRTKHEALYNALKEAYQQGFDRPIDAILPSRYEELMDQHDRNPEVQAVVAESKRLLGEFFRAREAFVDAVDRTFSKKMKPECDHPEVYPRRVDHYLTYKDSNDVIVARNPRGGVPYKLTFEEQWGPYIFVGRCFGPTWFKIDFQSISEFESWINPRNGKIDWSGPKVAEQAMKEAIRAREDFSKGLSEDLQLTIRYTNMPYYRKDVQKLQTVRQAEEAYLQWLSNPDF